MNVIAIPASMVVVASLFIGYGSRFPQYTDPNWEVPFHAPDWRGRLNTAFDASTKGDRDAFDAMGDQWYAAKSKAQSPRDWCFDVGTGFILLGIASYALLLAKGINKVGDLLWLRSPKTQWGFFLLATVTWLSFIPAEWIFYAYASGRGDFPWFGDVIAIPCFGVLIFGIIGLPFVLLGVALAVLDARLPVPVFLSPAFRSFSRLDILFFPVAMLALLVTVMGVVQQPPIVPSAVATFYLILSGRAAAVNTRLSRAAILQNW